MYFPIFGVEEKQGMRSHYLIVLIQLFLEIIEAVTEFIFLGSKIIADGDCSHEIKRHLFLWRKGMTNIDSVLKSKYITILTKVYMVKAHTVQN